MPAISALRILFILCILAAHLREYLSVDIFSHIIFPDGLSPFLGNVGVIGFVFLSGFSLSMKYSGTNVNFLPFLYRRFIKIWPLYALVIFLHLFPVMYITIKNAVSHLLLVNVFFKEYSRNPGSVWFVSMIFQLYLFFPLLCRKASMDKWPLLVLFALSGYTVTILGNYSMNLNLTDTGLHYMPDFVFGICLASLVKDNKVFSFKILAIWLFLLIISGWVFFNINFAVEVTSKLFILTAVSFSLVILQTVFRKKEPLLLKAVSSATLGVFLFHRLIWKAMLSMSAITSIRGRFLYLVVLGIPIIFLISWLVQEFYNKKIVNKCWDQLYKLKLVNSNLKVDTKI